MLKKDGWTITKQQVRLVVADRWMWIDIQAEKSNENLVILLEVKGFENLPSSITYLHTVVGQYVVYRTILDYLEWEHPLYLAVPEAAFDDILGEEIANVIMKQIGIKLLVFSIEQEKIVQWKT